MAEAQGDYQDNERDSRIGANTAGGVIALAAAVKCAAGSSAAAKELADIVLEEAGADLRDVPSEACNTAQMLNRMMDAVLDAANASHAMPTRIGRRAHMAQALDRSGFVLVEVNALAGLVSNRIGELERLAAPQPHQPGAAKTGHPPLACAAETEAAGGEHHSASHLDFMEGDGFGTGVPGDPFGGSHLND